MTAPQGLEWQLVTTEPLTHHYETKKVTTQHKKWSGAPSVWVRLFTEYFRQSFLHLQVVKKIAGLGEDLVLWQTTR